MVDEADRELLNLEHRPSEVLVVPYAVDFVNDIARPPASTTSIRALFDLVRRTALHVDEAIDDILETLKG